MKNPGYASPACHAHEQDPAYAGYLTDAELLALLMDIRAAVADGDGVEDSLVRLDAEIARLGGDATKNTCEADPKALERARAALPKIADDGVYGLVKAVVGGR